MDRTITILQPTKALSLVFSFVAAFLMSVFVPVIVLAEEAPTDVVAPAEADTSVQPPGFPYATSAANDYALSWQWSMPDGGLTPDALIDPDNPDIPAPAQPSDIVLFGYEFLKQGAVISRGEVNSAQFTLDTPVTANGTYNLKVWSITREATTSIAAEGTMVITKASVTPLPNIDENIIPKPIDTTNVIKKQASTESAIINTAPLNSANTVNEVPVEPVKPSVLSANDNQVDTPVLNTVAVVKPSTQGWVILGLAWYFWLLIIAGLFVAGRGIMAYVNAR